MAHSLRENDDEEKRGQGPLELSEQLRLFAKEEALLSPCPMGAAFLVAERP